MGRPRKARKQLEQLMAEWDNIYEDQQAKEEADDPIKLDMEIVKRHIYKYQKSNYLYFDGEKSTHQNFDVVVHLFFEAHHKELKTVKNTKQAARLIRQTPISYIGRSGYNPYAKALFNDNGLVMNTYKPFTYPTRKPPMGAEKARRMNAWLKDAIFYWTGVRVRQPRHWEQYPAVRQFIYTLAKIVQRHELAKHHHRLGFLMIGPEGSGKGSLINIMRHIIGESNISSETPQTLMKETAIGTSNSLMMYFDDISAYQVNAVGPTQKGYVKNKQMLLDKLKSVIGNPYYKVRMPRSTVTENLRNWTSVWMFTDRHDPLTFAENDRRFVVFNTYGKFDPKEARAFWNKSYDDGIEEYADFFAYVLGKVKVKDKHLNEADMTDAKDALTKK